MGDAPRRRKTPLPEEDLRLSKALDEAIKTRREWGWKDWEKATGMSRGNLWKVARGEVAMTMSRALRLASALGTTVDELAGTGRAPEPVPDPRLSPARDRIGRLRQEVEALQRLLAPDDEPFESARPRIVSLEEVGKRRRKNPGPASENLVRLPIVGERLAAGMGSWPERPGDELEWLTFRESWAALSYPKDETRYVLAKLGDESIADSMTPEILPRSLLLLDCSDTARVEIEDGKPYLCVVDERADEPALAVKKVERVFRGSTVTGLRLISPNRDRHPEISVALADGQPIQHVVRARVVWWATTVE
jgi:transcriptional regulator with XRE-family HTH domain